MLAAAGSGGESFWILQGYYSTAFRFINPRDLAVDSSDNIYVVGLTRGSTGYTDGFVAKFDTEGVNQYFKTQRSSNSPPTVRNFRCVMDDNDNLYVAGNGYYLANSSTGQDLHITKFDTSDGSITWTKDSAYTYQNGITDFYNDLYFGNITIDSANDYPTVSYVTNDTQRGQNAHLQELTTTGSKNDDVLLNYGGDEVTIAGTHMRNGDWHAVLNLYETDSSVIFVQLDSANIFLPNYRKKINRSGADVYAYDAHGVSNSLYVCGQMVDGGNNAWIQLLYPSTGNTGAQRTIPASTYTSKYDDFRRVWYDSVNGNVWAITGSGNDSFDIVKFNTSLAMQGRYQISSTGNFLEKFYKNICTDSAGNVYVSLQDGDIDGMALFKLPPDLSVSGTYNGITISTATTDITSTSKPTSSANTTNLSISGDTIVTGSETFTETNVSWTEDTLSNL